MNYETAQTLSPSNFKRYTGIQKETFNLMLQAWDEYYVGHSNAGRPPKLTPPDQLLIALQYWREYRTYYHIAKDLGNFRSNGLSYCSSCRNSVDGLEAISSAGDKTVTVRR